MKILIIPSATLIPKEMRDKFGEIPTILFPLNNTPLIDYLYQQYKSLVDEIYVVVYKKKELVEDYINLKHLDMHVVALDTLKDLGYTVLAGIEPVKNHDACLFINFADTLIFNSLESETDRCFYNNAGLSETWTFFEKDPNNRITKIIDKQELEFNNSVLQIPFFVGCFYLTHSRYFMECLREAIAQNEPYCDSFYAALMEYTHTIPMQYSFADKWFDVGHAENYLKAKTEVQARNFNSIEIDEARGILKKTSKNKDKFIDEINWYLKLPNKLQYLAPRIYEYSIDRQNPYISMECYGYHTLHEIYLYGNLPLYKWQNIFERLHFAIQDMECYTVSNAQETTEAMRDIYINKTLSRLTLLRNQKEFTDFFDHKISINNKTYRSLNEYMELLPAIINQALFSEKDRPFTVIHGDLCFSNILLEENYGFIRVIDPRGRFGSFDIYGDPRYEMAKLLHSIEGGYDFIIEDMFEIAVHKSNIIYSLKRDTGVLLSVFKDVFRNELKEYSKIKLIESTLFLSMIPLHSDYISRQYAMLATGIMQLDEISKEFSS